MAPKKNSGRTRIEKSWRTELLPVRVRTMLSAKFCRKNAIPTRGGAKRVHTDASYAELRKKLKIDE